MADRQRRPKASDIYQRGRPLFTSGKVTWEEEFGDVADAEVVVHEVDYGDEGSPQTWEWPDLVPVVDCSNPRCYGGGILIDSVFRRVVSERLTEAHERRRCKGFEGSPKGARRTGDCLHVFVVDVKVTYKTEA